MRRVWALGAVLVLAAGAMAAAGSLAGAKSKKANSNVSIAIGFVTGTGFPFFEGSVNSGKGACVGGRRIVVSFQRNRGKKTVFGRTATDSNGHWQVFMQPGMRIGGYFAEVKKTGSCKYKATEPIAVAHNTSSGIRALRALHRAR